MKKLTQKQVDMLWGEDGPYSQANLTKQVRILDDQISRIFLEVEVDINPTTFEIIRKNRDCLEFKNDQMVQQLLDSSEHRGPYFGYVSAAFSQEYTDESVMYTAETALNYAQNNIIKMHKFIMSHYKIEMSKSQKTKITNKTKKKDFSRTTRVRKRNQ